MPKSRGKPARSSEHRSKLDSKTSMKTKRNRMIDEEFQKKLFSGKPLKKRSEATPVKRKSRKI